MRGFDASSSIYVDGVRDMGSISRDTFNVEQIDILKGPAGTDSGRGSPTGSVNLTSKQAQMQDAYSGRVTVGSAKQKRATADVNQVLNAEKGVAFRFNALVQDSGKPGRDVIENKRWAIAPTLSFGLGSPTRLTLSYLHVDQDNIPDGGVPTIGLPGYTSPDSNNKDAAKRRLYLNSAAMVDPEGFYGSTSDYDKVKADMVTVRVDHDFSPALKLQNTSRFGKTKQDYLLTAFTVTGLNANTGALGNLITETPAGVVLPASQWLLKRNTRTIKDQRNEILTNQTNLTAEFDAAGMKHTAVALADIGRNRHACDARVRVGVGRHQVDLLVQRRAGLEFESARADFTHLDLRAGVVGGRARIRRQHVALRQLVGGGAEHGAAVAGLVTHACFELLAVRRLEAVVVLVHAAGGWRTPGARRPATFRGKAAS
eukprot:gene24145-27320_t